MAVVVTSNLHHVSTTSTTPAESMHELGSRQYTLYKGVVLIKWIDQMREQRMVVWKQSVDQTECQ